MQYVLTSAGKEESAASFTSPDVGRVFEWYKEEGRGDPLACARDVGLSPATVRHICRGLVRERLMEIDREAEEAQEESYGRVGTTRRMRPSTFDRLKRLFG